MFGPLRKRTAGTPLSQDELEQRREAGKASAEKRRRNLGDFEREVRAIPLLGESEERDLIARWKDKGDTKARDRVVEAHLRLAVSGARKLAGYGLSNDDMVAAGNIGLLQAAAKFDPANGARFATFALPYVRGAQFAHVLDNKSIVRSGTSKDQKRLFFSLRGDLRTTHGQVTEEKIREIAERRKVKASSVRDMIARHAAGDASLNVRAGEDEDGEEWLDRLSSGEHAEDKLVSKETDRLRRATVARAIAKLSDRERRVMAARHLRQPPATLQEVGRALGVSAERVRQIEGQAIRRVQAAVAAEPRLTKRDPGTPLSDKELRQRREAARSRWATGGGALAGALAATTAVRAIAPRVADRKIAADETGVRAFSLAATRRHRRHERINETLEARRANASRPFAKPVAQDEAKFVPPKPGQKRGAPKGRPGPVTQRVRDLRAMVAGGDREHARLDARATEIDEAFRSGRSVPQGLSESQVSRAKADLRTRLADAGREIDELTAARPTRKVERAGAVVTRRAQGWVRNVRDGRRGQRAQQVNALPGVQHVRREHAARIPGDLDRPRMRQLRGALNQVSADKATIAHARVETRWHTAAPGLKGAFEARAKRALTTRFRGKWALPALAAGAVAGAAAGYGLTKMAPPPDDMPLPPEPASPAVEEARLATRLGALFRSWLETPARVGNRDDIAQALDPIWGILRRGADAAVPPSPPTDDSLYGTPDDRVIAVSFDARSPEVERRLREYALDRIRAITDESRETIRRTLIDAAQLGLPVEEQARRIREAIGLSPGQQNWVTSYRQGLEALDPRVLQRALRDRRHDSPISRAIATDTPLAPDDIDRYVASYHRRALAYRSITIARTEALRGANTGMVEGARVMLQDNPDVTVEKTWIATKDPRTRDAHRALDGKIVTGLDSPFEIDGEQIRWPHDDQASARMTVNCRCTLGLRLIPKEGRGRFIAEAA